MGSKCRMIFVVEPK